MAYYPPPKLSSTLNGFIDFYLIGYGWYVDMYIGLFLLIPFINKMFTDKKQDMILIISLLFLTLLPTVCKTPTLIVSQWRHLWPVTYYVIGAYISRYKFKVSTKLMLTTLVSVFLAFSIISLLILKGHIWNLGNFESDAGLEKTIISVLFFMIILNINFDKLSEKIKNIISETAKLSLGIYLSSYIFDNIAYHYLNEHITNTPAKLEYFFVIVPFVFICSLITAKFTDIIQNVCLNLFSKCFNFKNNK